MGEEGHTGCVCEYRELRAQNPMKTEEIEQKGIPLSMGTENHITKIQLLQRGLEWQCPVPKQLLAFLRAGLLQPDTAGKPAPWGSEGPFTAQNPVPQGLRVQAFTYQNKTEPGGKTQAKAGTT